MRRTRLWVGLVLCGLCVVVGLSGVAGGTASGPTAPVVGSPEWPGDAGDGAQVGAEQFRRQFVGNDRPDPPLADAGLDRVVEQNETVYLDASGSVALTGRLEAYEWTIDPPQGSSFAPACRTCEQTEFVPRRPGRYAVTVTVTDSAGGTATDTLYVSVGERTPPDATLAGPTRLGVGETGTFTLDAQPRTHPLLAVDWLVDDTYRESFFVEAVGAQARRVSFANPGRHTVSARVVDESGSSGTATAEVLVGTAPSPPFTVTIDRVRPPRDTGNDTLTLRATVTNTGNATGAQDIRLERAGVELDRFRNLRLAPGESRTVTLLWADAVAVPGEHTLRVATDNDSDARTVQVGRVEEVVLNVTTRTLGTLDGVYANETVPVRADLVYYNGTTRTVPVSSSDALTLEASGSDPLSVRGGTLGSTYTPGLNDTVSLTVSYTANGITRTSDPETVRVFDPIQNVTTRVDRTGAGLPRTPFDDSHLLATGTQSYPLETTVTLAGGAGTRPLAQIAAAGDDDDLYTVTAQRDSASLDPYGLGGTYSLEPTQATAPGSPIEVTTRLRPAGVPATRPNHTAVASAPASAVAVTNATVDITAEDILVDETTTVRITTTLEQTHPERDGRRTGPATNFTVENTTFDDVVDETGPLTLDTTPLANGSYTLTGTGNGNGTVTLTIEASQTPYLETGNVTASDTVGVGLPKYDKQPVLLGIPGVPRSGEVLNRQYGIKDGEFKLFSGSEEPMQLYLVYPRDSGYDSDAAFKQRFAAAVSSATGLPTFEEVKNGSRNISNQAWHGGQFKRLYTEHHGIERQGNNKPFTQSIREGYAVRLSGANSPVSINDADTDTLFNVIPGTGVQLPQSPNINIPIGIRPGPDTRIGTGNDYTVEIRDSKTTNESVPFQKTTGDPLGVTPPGENVTGQTPIGTVSADTVGIATVRVSATGTTYNNIQGVTGSFKEKSDLLSGVGTLFTVLLGPNGNGPNVRTDDGPTIGITEGDEIEINTYDNVGAAAEFDNGEQLSCFGIKNKGGCDADPGNGDTTVRQPFQGIDFAGAGADRTDLSIVGKSDWRDDRGGTINRSTSDPGLGTVVLGTQTMKKNGNSLTSGETLTIERGTATTNPWGLEISHDTRPKDGQRELVTGFNGDNWKLVVEGTNDGGGTEPN